MHVGLSKVNITPELGLQMLGMPEVPRAEGVLWPLHCRVMAVEVGDTRAAIICLDMLGFSSEVVADLRERIAHAAGIAPGHILITCSHTHRAPSPVASIVDDPASIETFLATLYEQIVVAATAAVADLQPAELCSGSALAPGWAFNRRPMYANNQVGTHGWTWLEGFIAMEDEPDETVRVLAARTPDGAMLGGLVNFSCHPTAMGHDPVYSADYPGALTGALEAEFGGTFSFMIGAAGDTSTPDPSSRNPESGFGSAHTAAMGAGIAARAAEAIFAARPVPGHTLTIASTTLHLAQRLATEEQCELARWYLEERPADLDELEFTRRLYGHDFTFLDGKQVGNERHAEEMLRMWEWQHGPDARLVEEVEIQVMVIGDVALVAMPVEIFTEFGEQIQAASPFPDTLIVTLANGSFGYVPTQHAFAHGGYEPRFAYPSRLEETAGEKMSAAATELLNAAAR